MLEQSSPGERGILLPEPEPDVAAAGDGLAALPAELRRTDPPGLPELSQPQVLRALPAPLAGDARDRRRHHLGAGTCTMKYSPEVNESSSARTRSRELHPEQDDATVQGSSRRCGSFERALCEISGMDRFSFQPGGGSPASTRTRP